MHAFRNRALVFLATALLLLVSAVGLVAVLGLVPQSDIPAVHAQEAPAAQRTITVVGEGKVSIKPDIARAIIGVEVVKPSVKEASAENKAIVEAVLAALQEQGVAEKDIQTSGFSVYTERYGPEGPLAESDLRYRVTNNVNVTIRNLDNVGTLLDAAIEAGANNIFGIEFALDDPSVVEAEARAKAIEDARTKAEELAQLTGMAVGEVLSVSEIIGSGGGYYASNFAERAAYGLGGGGGAPIAPGELELVMQLQVVYAAQ